MVQTVNLDLCNTLFKCSRLPDESEMEGSGEWCIIYRGQYWPGDSHWKRDSKWLNVMHFLFYIVSNERTEGTVMVPWWSNGISW